MRTSNLGSLIAILSSSVLSFIAGQYLPYVIAAFSGTIAAVPLAIFTVSAVVALVSVIYLVKLIISKAGNKKEADSGEEAPNKEQPTREVIKESVLKNKPIGKESNNPVEFGTQQNSSASVSPPPPPPLPPPPPPPIQIASLAALRNAKKKMKPVALAGLKIRLMVQ